MSYRIAISIAAIAIGMSFIATDALARGGGGGGGGKVGKGVTTGVATGVRGPTVKGTGTGVTTIPRVEGVRNPPPPGDMLFPPMLELLLHKPEANRTGNFSVRRRSDGAK